MALSTMKSTRALWHIWGLAVLLCASMVDGYSFAGSTYTAPAASAYTWSASYPQSCMCMENAVAKSSCSLFSCQCSCDVTAGVCDYGCCCDPDCSSAQQSRFGSVGVCPSSYSASNVPLCYSSVELYKINPRLPLGGQPTAEAAVAGALCISKYNYATKQEYYTQAAVQTSDVFQQSKGQKTYSYGDKQAVTAMLDGNYDMGDNIAAFTTDGSTTTLYPKGNGYFALPQADFSGQCNDNNPIRFEMPVAASSCAHRFDVPITATASITSTTTATVPSTTATIAVGSIVTSSTSGQIAAGTKVVSVSTAGSTTTVTLSVAATATSTSAPLTFTTTAPCTVDLAVQSLTNAYIASTADVRASSGSATTANAVRVTLGTVTYQNPLTGKQTPVTAAWTAGSCTTTMPTADVASGATCNFATDVATGAASKIAISSGAVCHNVVKQVSYIVAHAGDAASAITSVTANIVVTDVPMPNLAGGYGFSGQAWDASLDGFVQTFSVDFNGAFTGSAATVDAGNIVSRARSGNPGYLMGKPVVFGLKASTVVNEQVGGLVVPSPVYQYVAPTVADSNKYPFSAGGGLSECPSSTSFGHAPVAFGYDMSTGCSLTLSRADFKTFCTATGSTTYTGSTGLPKFFDFANGLVGAFGNADPLDPTQWIPMNLRASSPTRAFTDATGICSGVPSGLSYKFLVASAGEKAYPQNKIISSEVEVIYSNWVYSVPYSDTTSTMSFPLTITVSFVFSSQQALTGYAPPAPPVLFKVPYDVFYPFYMSPAAPSAAASPLSTLAPLLCALALALGLGSRI